MVPPFPLFLGFDLPQDPSVVAAASWNTSNAGKYTHKALVPTHKDIAPDLVTQTQHLQAVPFDWTGKKCFMALNPNSNPIRSILSNSPAYTPHTINNFLWRYWLHKWGCSSTSTTNLYHFLSWKWTPKCFQAISPILLSFSSGHNKYSEHPTNPTQRCPHTDTKLNWTWPLFLLSFSLVCWIYLLRSQLSHNIRTPHSLCVH